MKKVLLCLNGDNIPKKRLMQVIQKTDCIIAADGGANYLHRYNIIPDILIGDMDSVEKDVFRKAQQNGVKIITYPAKKNETDSELAIQYAVDQGADEIFFVGFIGDRFDHVMANIGYISSLLTKINIKIIHNNEDIYFVSKKIVIHGKKNDEVSLLPFHADAKGVVTTGLQYEPSHETLHFASTRGISNVMEKPSASIQLKKGILMVVHR